MTWREFWNHDHSIYVSQRHQDVHYDAIAAGLLAHLPENTQVVLDYGCGDALNAERVASQCRKLVLCDGAPNVVARLQDRFRGRSAIEACLPEELDAHLGDGEADRIFMVSVAQYLSRADMLALAQVFRRKLKTGGQFILADVIAPDTGIVQDTQALLGAAFRHGFLLAAIKGLVTTAFSDYPKLRKTLGLTRYAEDDILALVREAGFTAHRHHANIGLNQNRMTLVGTKTQD